ncbi:MAG TPA: CAP domain-containing protein [Nannocystaceae bacterium]|nr:CAP domain-containing protein [Nannocystaceae bacterium]
MIRKLAITMLVAGCEPAPDHMLADEEPAAIDLPAREWCDDVRAWPDDALAIERELHDAIDDARSDGGRCGTLGYFVPSDPLVVDGALTCAARKHARDMDAREYFAHVDPEGGNVVARMKDAGYVAAESSELIAAGDVAATAIVDIAWLAGDPHCAALLAPEWQRVGMARQPTQHDDRGAYWVVVLATEPG